MEKATSQLRVHEAGTHPRHTKEQQELFKVSCAGASPALFKNSTVFNACICVMHITSPTWMVRALQRPRGQGAPEMQAVELTMGGKPGTRNDVFSSADKYHQEPWNEEVPHQGSCSSLQAPGADVPPTGTVPLLPPHHHHHCSAGASPGS